MGTPHEHAEIIKAWADGADIEYKEDGHWLLIDKPTWQRATEYRVRITPAPKREPLTVHVYCSTSGQFTFWDQWLQGAKVGYIGEFVLQPKEQIP